MSKGRGKSGEGERAITAGEAELWKHATRALDPVKAKPRVNASSPSDVPASPPRTVAREPAAPAKPKPDPSELRKPVAPRAAKTSSAPLADFDRRKARQIASGKIEIGARIDLHGSYQRDARARLRAFLFDAHAKGHKTVLVITGKGADKEPADRLGDLLGERQRGVLRRNVPLWLGEPDLRAIVLSFTEASTRHGGAGALYVQLRKAAQAS